jgi:hypothetical protein
MPTHYPQRKLREHKVNEQSLSERFDELQELGLRRAHLKDQSDLAELAKIEARIAELDEWVSAQPWKVQSLVGNRQNWAGTVALLRAQIDAKRVRPEHPTTAAARASALAAIEKLVEVLDWEIRVAWVYEQDRSLEEYMAHREGQQGAPERVDIPESDPGSRPQSPSFDTSL